MSVDTSDLRHSWAYTKTVSNPVSKNAHQTQLPYTPLVLTISVTKLGVSVENVVATIEKPNSHQGMFLLDKKYALVLDPEVLEAQNPMPKTALNKTPMMA